jgi:DNA-binding MarR family transcriptional regulator
MVTSNEDISSEAFHRLLRLMRYFRQHARQVRGQGISPRDYAVLRFLSESGSATVGEVQAYLYRSPSTTSALLSWLEEAGYVTRNRSEKDNRVVIVGLTSAGRDVVQHTPLGGVPLLRRQMEALPKERLILINDALAEILQLMEVSDSE